MHPILGHPRRLAIYVSAWLLVGALLALAFGRGIPWTVAGSYFLPLSLIYAFITLSTWYVCRAFPLGEPSDSGRAPWRLLAVHTLGGTFASLLWVGLAGAWAAALDWLTGTAEASAMVTGGQWVSLFFIGLLLFWLAVVFHYLLIAFDVSREAERRSLELSLLARESELRALRAQIDPHFIFNSLHSISALTTRDAAAARRMCLLLADFLRDTLRLGSHVRIPLDEEMRLVDRFLAIEQIRLGPRLQVERDVPPDAASCLVPPLLLQPLVENAIVHGIGTLVEGGVVRIAARHDDGMLTITIENPRDPEVRRTRGVGLGLELLRRRLTTEYGVYDAVRTVVGDDRFGVMVKVRGEQGQVKEVQEVDEVQEVKGQVEEVQK